MPQAMSNMMTPVLALVVWTLIVLVWLYTRRIPAMRKAGIDPKRIKGSESYADLPPMDPKAIWVADNYNHLFEQPTIFYAIALTLAMLGAGDGTNLTLAWVYVGMRVVHSLVQALINKIELRFAIFFLSSLVLIGLIYNAVRIVCA